MGVITAAGTTLKIGTTLTDPTSDTFITVGEVTQIGEFGRNYELIKFTAFDQRATLKFKGSYDEGDLTLQLGRNVSDGGQAALLAASVTDGDYNVQILLNDDPGGTGSSATTVSFKAKVMSFRTKVDNINSVVGASVMLAITGTITEVEAIPGSA